MSDIAIRQAEGQDPQPFLLWDTVWDAAAGQADWAPAGADEAQNRGGLRAQAALASAVILCLFTDRRVPDEHHLRHLCADDPRGYWGDGIDVRADLGETELGSLLWLVERAPLSEEIARFARAEAESALAVLVEQGAVAAVKVETEVDQAFGRLNMAVQLVGRDGRALYDERFDIVWTQLLR